MEEKRTLGLGLKQVARSCWTPICDGTDFFISQRTGCCQWIQGFANQLCYFLSVRTPPICSWDCLKSLTCGFRRTWSCSPLVTRAQEHSANQRESTIWGERSWLQ